MATGVFTKADLDNIDYDETQKVNHGFFNFHKLHSNIFTFALKDGRTFRCEQDLDATFTIHSDKYGDVEGDFWLKIAVEIIDDNDKFVTIVKNMADIADYLSYGIPNPDTFVQDGIVYIIKRYYAGHEMPMLRKLAEMGLDENNKLVTIKPADEDQKNSR